MILLYKPELTTFTQLDYILIFFFLLQYFFFYKKKKKRTNFV
jgi:hypothetical protein